MSFGHRLRALRRERGLTRKELATNSGLNPDSITYLERRYTPPRQQTVQRLADALAVSEETLTSTGISPVELMPALLRELPPPGTPWSVGKQEDWLAKVRADLRKIYGAYGHCQECDDETPEPDSTPRPSLPMHDKSRLGLCRLSHIIGDVVVQTGVARSASPVSLS